MKMLVFGSVLALLTLALPLQQALCQPYTISTIAGSPLNPGSNDGTNSNAQFTAPTGLTLDKSGRIYLADGNAIRRVILQGTNWVVTTLAGSVLQHGTNDGTNTLARFDDPQGLAVDARGNLYVADTLNNAIRKITPVGTNWVVNAIAGLPGRLNYGATDGTNTDARFSSPSGIAVDGATNLYVADFWSNIVRKLTPVGTNWVVTTIAGLAGSKGGNNGTNQQARFNLPAAVALDASGVLYVSDFGNDAIRKITRFGTNWAVTTLAGQPGAAGSADGLGSAARFNLPQCVAIDAAQNIFVTDSGNATLRKVTSAGLVSTLAGLPGIIAIVDGTGPSARFAQPFGIGVDVSGTLFISDYLGYCVRLGRLAPVLQYAQAGRRLVLSWPLGLTGFVPQVSTTVVSTTWAPLTNTPFLVDQYYYLTNNMPGRAGFYRLMK